MPTLACPAGALPITHLAAPVMLLLTVLPAALATDSSIVLQLEEQPVEGVML